jgi:hypothetical protein
MLRESPHQTPVGPKRLLRKETIDRLPVVTFPACVSS